MFSANPDLKQNVDAACDILKAAFDYFFHIIKIYRSVINKAVRIHQIITSMFSTIVPNLSLFSSQA